MAEAMRDEVAAGSAKPARDVQPGPAGAHKEDGESGGKPTAAGHGRHAGDATETKPPKTDEVRRSAQRAADIRGRAGSAAKKGQGTSLHGGKADPKGEVGAEGAATAGDAGGAADGGTKAAEEAAVPEVCEIDPGKKVSSAADAAPSGREVQEEPLSYEPFWMATERGRDSSEKPETPGGNRKNEEKPGVIFQNQPSIVEEAAEDANTQERVDSTVAVSQISIKPPDLGATTKASSTLSLIRRNRGERLADKEDLSTNTIGEEHPGTVEGIVTNEQQSSTPDSTAIDSTKEDYRATARVTAHETNTVEAEATAKREITLSKPLLTSAASLSNCTQEGAVEHTSTELTDKKPDSEKKSATDHGGASQISCHVVKTDAPLSTDSVKVIEITLRPETGGKELESMTEASEATLKVIPLSESLCDKKSANKAKKVAEVKQSSSIIHPGGANEVLELSTNVREETIGVLPEASEVGQVSVDSKMEITTTDNEVSKPKASISKKSNKEKSSFMESTDTSNSAQKPTEEAPSSDIVSQDVSHEEQIPTKTPEGTDTKDQVQRKQSHRKPAKTTKKDSMRKQEAVSEPADLNIGANADVEVTVDDLHKSKTDTETSATVAKESASAEKPKLPKTVSDQKSASKDTKKQPKWKRSATQSADKSKPTEPPAESVVEPSTAATTDHDGSGALQPSECNEVSSKGALSDGMKAKAQSNKKTGLQKTSSKNTKMTVSKTGSSSTLAGGPQKTDDTVSPVTDSSTTKFPTDTKSVSSVPIKKDVTKTESDSAKRNQKRNVKAAKTQHGKGKSVAVTTKSDSKPQQQAERVSDETSVVTALEYPAEVKMVVESEEINTKDTKTNSGRNLNNKTTKSDSKPQQQAERVNDETSVVIAPEDTAEVKMVVESEERNTKDTKTNSGRKINNKTTKTTVKKSDQSSAVDSQKHKRSSQEASLRKQEATGTSAPNDGNVSSKRFSDQKKSNTKIEKDQMKPADSVSEAEKETIKATESDKIETILSGSATQNGNNGIQTVEPVTQSTEGDHNRSNEESQKTTKVTQRKPGRRNTPVRENKRKTTVKSNEKQSAGTAQRDTSADNPERTTNEMQGSGPKGESPDRFAQTSDSRTYDRNRSRNMVTLIVNRVEIGKEHDVPDSPVAATETSLESTVNAESTTVHAAADTTENSSPTTLAEKVVSEDSPRKKSSSQKKARKEKASLKKLEEVCKDSEKEPPISSNEISTTNTGHVTDNTKTERTDIEMQSTVLVAKNVGAKTRLSKSPSDLKRKSRVANPQVKRSSSLVAIPNSKSKTTVLVDGAKVPSSGDTGLTKAKTVSLKKSESFTAVSIDNIKRQPIEGKGRQRIWSLKQQKVSSEEGKMQTSQSKAKNTKEKDSVLEVQHTTSKPISSFTKEGKTESKVLTVFEAPESAMKDTNRREENKQLATINSDEADAGGKSPRKIKGDQNKKVEESIQNIGTGDVDRSTKIQTKTPREKSVESSEPARGNPASPRLRRQKPSQHKEETKANPETKVQDAGEDNPKTLKDVTEGKSHAARKSDNVPASGLSKHGNSPRRRTDEDVVSDAKQKNVCVKHETGTNDKLNNVDSAQKKPGQVKHETVPTTLTVTIKAGDNKGAVNKSAGDTARVGETIDCTISTSVTKKKDRRSSKLCEQSEQTPTVGEKTAASGQSPMTGDGVKVGSPRKQTAEQKDPKVKAKKGDGICVIIEEVPQDQKPKTSEKSDAESLKKQRGGTNQEQLTSAKDTGQPPSSPRKSTMKSPRGVSKTAPAASPRSEVPPEINSVDKEAARIAIVEIEENDVTVSYRDKKKSSPSGDASSSAKYCGNGYAAKALDKGNPRESNPSPRSKQTTVKKGVNPSVRTCEHSEENTLSILIQHASKTDASAPKRNGNNGSDNPRGTSPQRLIAQLRTFMTQASLLNKLDLKSKILDCIGVNQVRDGYKIPKSRGKVKAPTAHVSDLKKVAAALKVGRKRLEDQASGKLVSVGGEESKKELLSEVGKKSSIAMAEEARNKLIVKAASLRSDKYRDRKSTSSGFSSSSGTPRPILVRDRARKRKVHKERKGVPRVKFNETTSGLATSSSRPGHTVGSKHQRWVSATPEIPARVKQVSPTRYAAATGAKIPVGIVSSTMLALKRMRASSAEHSRPHSPSPTRRPSKPIPSATAAIMAVTMKAREIAKVQRYGETKSTADRRSRSPKTKRATTKGSDMKRTRKPEQPTHDIVIRGLTAAAAPFTAEERTDETQFEFAPAQHPTRHRERSADEYDRTPIITQTPSEVDKPISPRRGATERAMPTWNSGSFTPSPTRRPSRSPTTEKSPTLRVIHDNKRPVRTKTTFINSSPTDVPCSVAITKKTSVPAQTVKRATRKGVSAARAAIEHVVNIDIRMGSMAKDSAASEDGRGRPQTPTAKSSVATRDSSVGTEEMQVLDVCIRALPAGRGEGESADEASVHTLLRAKEKSEAGAGDVDAAGRDSSESMLAFAELQAAGAGDRVADFAVDGEGDEDSGDESDVSSKTWPPATLVTPTTKTLAASFPRFSTSSVPEEAARATAALERSLRLVSRACQARPLECDLRWSAWMSALHAGDPDAAATPFPASLSRSGRRDVDAALAAAVRVPALWLLAGLRAAELGARTVKLLHWLLVRLPAEGPALRAIDARDIKSPCRPSAAFSVRVCAGSSLDARLRWRSRGLPAFEAWASPAPSQLHALVCGGAATPVGVLSLTLAGALRRAQPGYGCGASRLGSRLRCVLKCDVAHHPELVERIGADAVVVRGLDLVRVRQLLVFSEPLPAGALAAWAARAIKKRRLAVALAAVLLTYLLVAAIVWMADLGFVGVAEGPNLLLGRLLTWAEEPQPPEPGHKFSFWA